MKRPYVLLAAVLASAGLLTAGKPKLAFSWKNPQAPPGPYKHILVLALNGHAENRALFEDELVADISAPGQVAVQSYEFAPRPDGEPVDIDSIKLHIEEQKFDSVLVARLTKHVETTTYVPGEYYSPLPYYRTFYGYYATLAPVIYSPGYMETETEAEVEMNFYSTEKSEGILVWTGTTNTFDAHSPPKVIRRLVKLLSEELADQKIIVPKPE